MIAHLFGAPGHPPDARSLLWPPAIAHPLRRAQSPCWCTITSVPKIVAHLFGAPSHPPDARSLRRPSHPCHSRLLRPPKQSCSSWARPVTHLMHVKLCSKQSHSPSLPPVIRHSRSLRHPTHRASARSLVCPKQSHTCSARPVTHLMHDHFCAQTIAHLFGAPYHLPNARSLLCQDLFHTSSLPPVTHLPRSLHRPSHPACAPPLLCPKQSHTSPLLFHAHPRLPNNRAPLGRAQSLT